MNYKKVHDQIIERAISENRKKRKIVDVNFVYYESHHIIPKCIGGSDDKSNLVLLTAREHFLIHWLLYQLHPDNYKLALSFNKTCQVNTKISNRNFTPSSKAIEESKLAVAKANVKIHSGKIRSIETRDKMKNAHLNKTEEQKKERNKKISETLKGKKHSQERIENMTKGINSMSDEAKIIRNKNISSALIQYFNNRI